ncbi:hypothetical protein [Jeotgalicoccus sp. ATCC 8456]|uniref:hypothetical protein n=1 Tax=Jeotgalicoccus sp. ATCC 8456 TaxID=946435 RepID=UPI001F29C261|nr:hypothetical protein [Jeotgalicoccus sp. ATCC 8456]
MKVLLLIMFSITTLAACSNQIDQTETTESEQVTDNNTTESKEVENDTETDSTSSYDDNNSVEDQESDVEESEKETEEQAATDLIEDSDIIEGYWINYSGVDDARSHMSRTDFIPYDASQDYTLTSAAYVSYFYGDSFIKTNNYGHEGPYLIESVPEADQVIVSFGEPEADVVELRNEAVDNATADAEESTTPDEYLGQGKPDIENLQGQIMFGQDFLSGDDVFPGQRIDERGRFVDDEEYTVTEALEYNSSRDYVITAPAMISYYRGSRFIETVEISTAPAYLPAVDNANYINISFNDEYVLDLNMIEVE